MWNAILSIFGKPWVASFVFFVLPFIWAWFHLNPSSRKSENEVDQLLKMCSEEKIKAERKSEKKKD